MRTFGVERHLSRYSSTATACRKDNSDEGYRLYYTLKDTLCRSYTYLRYRNERTLEVYRTLQSYHAGL